MKTDKELAAEKEAKEMTARFWECFRAIKDSDKRISGKMAYAEARRQLNYSPPLTKNYLSSR